MCCNKQKRPQFNVFRYLWGKKRREGLSWLKIPLFYIRPFASTSLVFNLFRLLCSTSALQNNPTLIHRIWGFNIKQWKCGSRSRTLARSSFCRRRFFSFHILTLSSQFNYSNYLMGTTQQLTCNVWADIKWVLLPL